MFLVLYKFNKELLISEGGRKKRRRSEILKMASGVDDVDLIDLESGVAGACVTRINVPDATPEEQEHLLDVCPPKLEQKLSLTRRYHDRSDKLSDNEDILVTLGHDQIVPMRKRIDVVSTDTIKRVRDITKNLEPVINYASRDFVDNGGANFNDDDDNSYETREINDAFEFLAELDDNDEAACDKAVVNACYPLEPMCYIIKDKEPEENGFDNAAFEASPPCRTNKYGSKKRPHSINFDFDWLRVSRNSPKRLRSLIAPALSLDFKQKPEKRKIRNIVNKRKRRLSERISRNFRKDRPARRRRRSLDGCVG